jgi:glycosyltransferase involved in cell wall biosynthesis
MDALLLTSVTEGLPNVVIEAQAAGVPVVSTDVGGVREIIDDGRTGFAVSEATATGLADRILRILSDSQWMESAKAEARMSARARFADDAMIARTLAVYGCPHVGHTPDNFQASTELRRESASARL